ncbi:MAG: c-type cytochrome [Planctomycetes bacterium]|nr:c-type cytochrome [Planctomycetota bacterium]
MSVSADRVRLCALLLCVAMLPIVAEAARPFGIGTPATPREIAGWDIDVRPDGLGLPPGGGTADDGESVYEQKCASCHGEFGEARGNYPVLMGGRQTLTREHPVKTVGSYWPYATTVFDYVRRAMPFGHAQSLSDDETYALTAWLLYLNEIIDADAEMNAETLPAVQMPNRDGFFRDDRPDTPTGEPCMSDCRGEFTVIGRARHIDVTPEEEAAAAAAASASAGDEAAARGAKVFQSCAACHSLSPGEHRVGPSLHGIIGRAAGTAEGFDRYSPALAGSGVTWGEDALASFLAAPQAFIPGNAMPFAGISDEAALQDLLEHLRRAAQ